MDQVEYLRQLRSGPIEKELPFTQEEYDARVNKVRAEMAVDGLDGLIVMSPANLHYLSGYYTFSVSNLTALVLPSEGDAGVVTASCEIPAAVLSGWVEDVVSFAWDEGEPGGVQGGWRCWRPGGWGQAYRYRDGPGRPGARTGGRAGADFAQYVDSGCIRPGDQGEEDQVGEGTGIHAGGGEDVGAGANASSSDRAGVTDNELAQVGYSTIIGAGVNLCQLTR